MVVLRKKKSTKQRGSRTHGWGAGKKHRGKGHRGGKGNAGSGKRGQQKMSWFHAHGILPLTKRIRHPHQKSLKKIITIEQISINIESWLSSKKIKKDKDTYIIDLSELGYDKLLGTGKLAGKVDVVVKECTSIARRKIESLNGKVTVSEIKEEQKEEIKEGEAK